MDELLLHRLHAHLKLSHLVHVSSAIKPAGVSLLEKQDWFNLILQKIRQTSRWLGVSTLGQALFVYTHPMPPFWCATAAKRCARRQTCSTFTWKRQFEVHFYMWIFIQTTWCAVNVHASISSCHLKIIMQAVPIRSLYLFSCRMLKGNLLWNPVRAMLYVCRCEVSPFCHRFFIWLIFLSSCRSHTT